MKSGGHLENDLPPQKIKFNVRQWKVSEPELSALVDLAQQSEKVRIQKFVFEEDKKRGIAGHILIRNLLSSIYDIKFQDVAIERTRYGKPHFVPPETKPVTYFNLSHHGEWVVLCWSFSGAVGVDVVEYDDRRGSLLKLPDLNRFFKAFSGHFTQVEWGHIGNSLKTFYENWALKEAFIKMIGRGLSYPLSKLEFTMSDPSSIVLNILCEAESKEVWQVEDCKFGLETLDEMHCVAISSATKFPFDKEWVGCSINKDGHVLLE